MKLIMSDFDTGFHALESAKEYEKQAEVIEDETDAEPDVSVAQDAASKDVSAATVVADEAVVSNS